MRRRFDQSIPHYLSFFQTYLMGSYNNYSICGCGLGASPGQLSLTGNYFYATPIYFAKAIRLYKYGIIVSTVTTGGRNLTFGIFADNLHPTIPYYDHFRYPGRKLDEQAVTNVTTTGFYSKTLGTPILLRQNTLYWGVIASDATGAISIRSLDNTLQLMGYVPNIGNNAQVKGFYKSQTYASSLPDPFPTDGVDQQIVPAFFLREMNQSGS